MRPFEHLTVSGVGEAIEAVQQQTSIEAQDRGERLNARVHDVGKDV